MTNTWHILGAGAIGCLFASALHRSGTPVTVLQRPGITPPAPWKLCIDNAGTTTELSLPTSPSNAHEAISHVLLTTKSYDVLSALSDIAHRLKAGATVVILVNGMGVAEKIIPKFPELNFVFGTTTEGAYRIAAQHFCHAGSGHTFLGQTGVSAPAWFKAWENMDLECAWDKGIEGRLWQKLAVNCAINPLTALEQCLNGELAKQTTLATRVEQLCAEIAQVSHQLAYESIAANVHVQVKQVIAATAANKSSMLQDRLAGRVSENEYISGYFIKRARELGLSTPENTALYNAMREIDQAIENP